MDALVLEKTNILPGSVAPPYISPSSRIDTPSDQEFVASNLRKVEQNYLLIGKMLLVCEACLMRIGIPWLPPTARVRALRKDFYLPLADFVRQSLVEVDTSSLSLYSEDLEAPEVHDKFDLGISLKSRIERHGITLAVLALAIIIFVLAVTYLNIGVKLAFGLACIAGIPGLALCALTTTEFYRRKTFHTIIHDELCRRKGFPNSRKKGVGMMSIEPNV